MTNFLLAIPNAYWFAPQAWMNEATGGFGQPGAGDTAFIQNGVPWVYGSYLDGPTIAINDITAGSTDGVAFYNANIGGDTSIFVTNTANSNDTITLSNSVMYGNLFAQSGAATLTVPGNTYGLTIGTTIVGGITNPAGVTQTASLAVDANGSFSNYGAMYAFTNGTLSYSMAGRTVNAGNIVANAGTVNFNPVSTAGTLDNEGSLLAANNGTINVNSALTLGTHGIAGLDNGNFVLTGPTDGSGMFNLTAGQMEFMSPAAMNVAPTVSTEFTGSAFSLVFNGATAVSDLLQAPPAPGGHDTLIVAAYFGATNGLQVMGLTLDTAHTYAASEFSASGNQLKFAA